MYKHLLFSVVILFFIGCTTLEDFRQMTPSQRAEVACNNQPDVKALSSELYYLDSDMNRQRQWISDGFKIIKLCEETIIKSATACGKQQQDGSQVCDDILSKKEVCKESSVTVDREYEQGVLDTLTKTRFTIKNKLNEKLSVCTRRVLEMSAEDAFRIYKN